MFSDWFWFSVVCWISQCSVFFALFFLKSWCVCCLICGFYLTVYLDLCSSLCCGVWFSVWIWKSICCRLIDEGIGEFVLLCCPIFCWYAGYVASVRQWCGLLTAEPRGFGLAMMRVFNRWATWVRIGYDEGKKPLSLAGSVGRWWGYVSLSPSSNVIRLWG